ncbi:hypothetical protein [Morganella morganii]|uniref:hypothetical protein n=1 Tax=Morganella morganii TaxID=582 RepID=UPI00339BCD84
MLKKLKSKPKSTQFMIAGTLLFILSCFRWFAIPEEETHNTLMSLAAIGIIFYGFSLRKDEKKE